MPQKRKSHPLENLSFVPAKPDPVKPAPDETRSSNVTLPASVWEWIDEKHAESRSNGGAPLRKAAIIRAVFQVVMDVDVDLSGSQSDEEIAERITRALAQRYGSTTK